MNNIFKQLLAGVTILILTACGGGESKTKVQDNGLTKDINELVPEAILEKMLSLGMPINRGGTPPDMEGIYEAQPLILLASSRDDDQIGTRYGDMHVKFHNQNNKKLEIAVSYNQSNHVFGDGIASFIVGTGNKFTIFSRIDGILDGQKYTSVEVYSGTITDNGITDYYQALFMVDDKGDKRNVLIENGDGRVFYDSDGVSRRIDSLDFKLVKNKQNKLIGSYKSILSSQ